jgi:GWxTD domain-containing protein
MTERAAVLLPLALVAALAAMGCGGGGASVSSSVAELTNPFLGPERSGWLVGAISRLATPQEIQGYLALKDDQQAATFIEAFWAHRDPAADKPGNPVREAFDRRSAEADRLYSEAGFGGHRTDRGVIYILYGAPEKDEFEVSPVSGGPPVEVWTYGAQLPSGLDGRRPNGIYRFIKRGDLTVLYFPGVRSEPVLPQVEPPNRP